jgi:hypothetical protein
MARPPQHEEWTPDEAWPASDSEAGPDRTSPVARLSLGRMMGIVVYFAAHNAVPVVAGSMMPGPRYRVRAIQAMTFVAVNVLATLSITTYLWAQWHFEAEQQRRGSRYDWAAERFDHLLAMVVSILVIGYATLFLFLSVLISDG